MISKYLKIILRGFIRRPVYPILNVICLSIGFITIFSVSAWLKTELSFDKFHDNSENIYRLSIEVNNPKINYHTHFARSWYQWLRYANDNIPGIEKTVRLSHWTNGIIGYDDRSFRTSLFFTDPSFFEVFSTEFITPAPDSPLEDPNTLLLTESAAAKYFGEEDPVGKTLDVYCSNCLNKMPYTVAGIVKDYPVTSHFHFDILASYPDPENTGWAYYYLLLGKGTNPDDILKSFPAFASKYVDEETLETLTPHLKNIEDIHLKSDNDREIEENGNLINIWLFSFLSLIILLLSLFNYMNLQNVGLISILPNLFVMRVLGAGRRSLLLFQTIEVTLVALLSILLSLFAYYFLSGSLDRIIGSTFSGTLWKNGLILITIISILFILTLITGLYPWIMVNVRRIIRNRYSGINMGILFLSGGNRKRMPMARALVVFQFAATSIVLILMYFSGKQVNFFMEQRLGGKDSKILVIRSLPVQVINKYEVFKSKLLENPLISDVTSSFEDPADENMDMMHFETTGITPEVEEKMLSVYPADDNYFRFYDIKFIAGHDFPDYYGVDSLPEYYILNREALGVLGWTPEEAVGKPFSLVFMFEGKNLFNGGEVVGVVEDSQPSSMKNEIKPYVYFQKSFWMYSSQVRYDVSRTEEVLEYVKNVWDEIYPGFPFEYSFIEDLYRVVYSNEIRLRNLGIALGILSVLLSGLGLWALTGVLFQARTKEIGIRRVHGASAIQVYWILLKEVLIMQIIALGTGLFAAWYLVHLWLNNFPYRVGINTGVFFITALVILIIALISAGYHAMLISNRNPVESLRYE